MNEMSGFSLNDPVVRPQEQRRRRQIVSLRPLGPTRQKETNPWTNSSATTKFAIFLSLLQAPKTFRPSEVVVAAAVVAVVGHGGGVLRSLRRELLGSFESPVVLAAQPLLRRLRHRPGQQEGRGSAQGHGQTRPER